MAYAAGGASAAAGVAAQRAIANASKASGVIVRVTAEDFRSIAGKSERPLVVVARGGLIKKTYRYLTSYKGLAFYTEADNEITLPSKSEVVTAEKIWIPG